MPGLLTDEGLKRRVGDLEVGEVGHGSQQGLREAGQGAGLQGEVGQGLEQVGGGGGQGGG